VIDLIALHERASDRPLLAACVRRKNEAAFVCPGEQYYSISQATSPMVKQIWNSGHDAAGWISLQAGDVMAESIKRWSNE
jgi:hypothetical protein